MHIPITKLNPNINVDLEQMKRFGCISDARIPRHLGFKFGVQVLRGCIVGFIQSGFVLYVPEQNKFYESRHVRVVESKVYKDISKSENIENGQRVQFEITAETSENSEIISCEHMPLSESDGECNKSLTKRKRGDQ